MSHMRSSSTEGDLATPDLLPPIDQEPEYQAALTRGLAAWYRRDPGRAAVGPAEPAWPLTEAPLLAPDVDAALAEEAQFRAQALAHDPAAETTTWVTQVVAEDDEGGRH